MSETRAEAPSRKTFVVSVENRKRRGAGHERAAEILAAARELFLENGVENVTTRQIAARVGVSQTALYVYYCNKEQMLDALAGETWRALGVELDAAAHAAENLDCPAQQLRALLAAFMRFWLLTPRRLPHHLHAQGFADHA